MRNFEALAEAIDYIEDNLRGPVSREEAARQCNISVSLLDKLFRMAVHCGVKEYLTKRRATLAAGDLKAGRSVTDTAYDWGYGSPEVFIRAFRGVWGMTPGEYRRKWRFTGIFPKRSIRAIEGSDIIMSGMRVDFSDAYEFLQSRRGRYVICFDVQGLTLFNQVSRAAGDAAIRETAARIDRAAGDDMLLLRIGGDEFALITDLTDLEEAKKLTRKVLAHNSEDILIGGCKTMPLSVWAAITAIPESGFSYTGFFSGCQECVDMSRHGKHWSIPVAPAAKDAVSAEAQRKYGSEARQLYGEDADASLFRVKGMSDEDWKKAEVLRCEFSAALGQAAASGDVEWEKAREACEKHAEWLKCLWKPGSYSPQAHRGLAAVYVGDERFTGWFDAIYPGSAAFLQKALERWLA